MYLKECRVHPVFLLDEAYATRSRERGRRRRYGQSDAELTVEVGAAEVALRAGSMARTAKSSITEELGSDVAVQDAVEGTMQFGAVRPGEHVDAVTRTTRRAD